MPAFIYTIPNGHNPGGVLTTNGTLSIPGVPETTPGPTPDPGLATVLLGEGIDHSQGGQLLATDKAGLVATGKQARKLRRQPDQRKQEFYEPLDDERRGQRQALRACLRRNIQRAARRLNLRPVSSPGLPPLAA